MKTSRTVSLLFCLVAISSISCGDGSSDAVVGSATPAAAGGAASSSGSGPRLRIITNGNSDWWTAVEKGMTDAAREFGAQAEMRRNTGAEPAGQIRLLEDALSLPDIQGVAVSVLEAESPGIADKMRDLQKAGKV